LENFQNFQARCGGLEANAFQVVWMCHFVFPSAVEIDPPLQ
jgi:hypothetical protein